MAPTKTAERCCQCKEKDAVVYCEACELSMCEACRQQFHVGNPLVARHETAGKVFPHPSLSVLPSCRLHSSSTEEPLSCAGCEEKFVITNPSHGRHLKRLHEELVSNAKRLRHLMAEQDALLENFNGHLIKRPVACSRVLRPVDFSVKDKSIDQWITVAGIDPVTGITLRSPILFPNSFPLSNYVESEYSHSGPAIFQITFSRPICLGAMQLTITEGKGSSFSNYHVRKMRLQCWKSEETAVAPDQESEISIEWKRATADGRQCLKTQLFENVFPDSPISVLRMTCLEAKYMGTKNDRAGKKLMGFDLPTFFEAVDDGKE